MWFGILSFGSKSREQYDLSKQLTDLFPNWIKIPHHQMLLKQHCQQHPENVEQFLRLFELGEINLNFVVSDKNYLAFEIDFNLSNSSRCMINVSKHHEIISEESIKDSTHCIAPRTLNSLAESINFYMDQFHPIPQEP